MVHFIQVKFMAVWYPLPPPEEDSHAFGASMARRHLAPLLEDLQARAQDGGTVPVVLDLARLEAATASYLKRTWVYLHRCALLGLEMAPVTDDPADPLVALPIHPFVSGLHAEVREELLLVLDQENLVCVEVVSAEDEALRGRILGQLDPALRETLAVLYRRGEASANDLLIEGRSSSRNISVNAWNNRLTDLMRLHLVARRKESRNWIYAPIMEGLSHE